MYKKIFINYFCPEMFLYNIWHEPKYRCMTKYDDLEPRFYRTSKLSVGNRR